MRSIITSAVALFGLFSPLNGEYQVLVTNSQDNTVSVIATMANEVVATIPVGMRPVGVVISPVRIWPTWPIPIQIM